MSEHGQMPVLEGQPLEDYIQQFIAHIAGLPGDMVRPRWQPEPPNLPDWGVDWAAIGIVRRRSLQVWPAIIHHCENEINGDGYDEMQRHEEAELLATFYGPHCDEYSQNLHNGLMIWQNYSALRLVGMAFIEISESIHTPELIRERWWDRVDKRLTFRRIIRRTYPIFNVLSASGFVIPDPGNYLSPFVVLTQNLPALAVGHAAGHSFAVSPTGSRQSIGSADGVSDALGVFHVPA